MARLLRLTAATLALGAFLGAATAGTAAAQGAMVERVAVGSALVHDVDLTTRQVLLETEDGRMVTVVAPAEARNLPQLKVGDTLTIGYYSSVIASLKSAGAEPMPTTIESGLVRAAEGERPAGAAVTELSSTVVFDAFDAGSGLVTFTGPTGIQRSVTVQDPEMRAFVETLKAGDQVDVVLVEVVAIEADAPQ